MISIQGMIGQFMRICGSTHSHIRLPTSPEMHIVSPGSFEGCHSHRTGHRDVILVSIHPSEMFQGMMSMLLVKIANVCLQHQSIKVQVLLDCSHCNGHALDHALDPGDE